MRFRGKSVRRKIVALLLVPLVSLTSMWAFMTYLTGREADQLLDVGNVVQKLGYPVEGVVQALQRERRQSLLYLADRRGADALGELRARSWPPTRPSPGSAPTPAPATSARTSPATPATGCAASSRACPDSARCAPGRDNTVSATRPWRATTPSSTPAMTSSPRSTPWRTWRWTSRAGHWSSSPAPGRPSPARTP